MSKENKVDETRYILSPFNKYLCIKNGKICQESEEDDFRRIASKFYGDFIIMRIKEGKFINSIEENGNIILSIWPSFFEVESLDDNKFGIVTCNSYLSAREDLSVIRVHHCRSLERFKFIKINDII